MHRKHTQQEVADYLDMSLRNYQKYESGDATPVFDNLVKIADFLNTSIDFLLGRDEFLQSLGVIVDVSLDGRPRRPKSPTR